MQFTVLVVRKRLRDKLQRLWNRVLGKSVVALYTVATINSLNPKRTDIYPADVVLQISATQEIYAGRCRKNNAW